MEQFSVKAQTTVFSALPRRDGTATNTTVAFWSRDSQELAISLRDESGGASPESKGALVYVVDDVPCLLELYTLVLEAAGHRVKAFDNRHFALADLKKEPEKPALLITDFRNTSMGTDRFLEECVATHPTIRILMATGFNQRHAWTSLVKPDRFLQKPFTPEQLQCEVRAALAGIRRGFASTF